MLEEPIFKESRRGKLDKGRLWAVSTEAKVAECLFLETSKKVVSLWTGSVAIPPQGRRRDQGLQETFKKARMPGQTGRGRCCGA